MLRNYIAKLSLKKACSNFYLPLVYVQCTIISLCVNHLPPPLMMSFYCMVGQVPSYNSLLSLMVLF